MRMCFSRCGAVVYISSTLAEGSQIQGQPELHRKTLYLFLKTFTKQNTCVTDLWNCLGSIEIGKQIVLKVFSILKHFLRIYFFCWGCGRDEVEKQCMPQQMCDGQGSTCGCSSPSAMWFC